MKRPLFQHLAIRLEAIENCIASGNSEWLAKHRASIEWLVKEHGISGSGFDNGTTLNIEQSTSFRLVLETSFHHMDENGSYDGWTNHTVRVRPSLSSGIELNVTGSNKGDIKDYIADTFYGMLRTEIEDVNDRHADAVAAV